MALERIGVPWFPQDGFEELRAAMADRDAIPETYAEWLQLARGGFKRLKREHPAIRVDKVLLAKEPFLAFCRERGLMPDTRGRAEYAAAHVARSLAH
jgi:hypothetical protein